MFSAILENQAVVVALLTLGAGSAMPIGGLIACIENFQSQWLQQEFRHSVMAFGGGALLSAVSLVLVPEGIGDFSEPVVALILMSGGVCFMWLDIFLDKKKSPAGQLAAMLSDFLPEAIALGAAFANGGKTGVLLAGLIAIQNLPEGFNAYRELRDGAGVNGSRILIALAALSLLGPVAGLTGYYLLADHDSVVGGLMLFAAGGILYLIFEDIAPQAQRTYEWGPPLGAVAGFTLGVLGQMIVD